MRADAPTEAAIFAAVDALFDHLANRRLEQTLAAFAPDPDVALHGSEVSEVVIGPVALRHFFERLYAKVGPRFTFGERRVSVAGDVAWFVADARLTFGAQTIEPYRLTGVLVRRDGRWLWALFSGSEPLPDRI